MSGVESLKSGVSREWLEMGGVAVEATAIDVRGVRGNQS